MLTFEVDPKAFALLTGRAYTGEGFDAWSEAVINFRTGVWTTYHHAGLDYIEGPMAARWTNAHGWGAAILEPRGHQINFVSNRGLRVLGRPID